MLERKMGRKSCRRSKGLNIVGVPKIVLACFLDEKGDEIT